MTTFSATYASILNRVTTGIWMHMSQLKNWKNSFIVVSENIKQAIKMYVTFTLEKFQAIGIKLIFMLETKLQKSIF